MMFSLKKSIPILFFLSFWLFQCSSPSSTMLVDSWSNFEYKTTGFENILIIGIARRSEVRTSFEYELKSHLKSKKVSVVASSDVMPLDEKIDPETFHKYFDDKDIDAVLVTRLVAVDQLPSNSNPQSKQLDAASFYEYYDNNYGAQAEAVMDDQNLILRVETNLYETEKERKIWSCTSKTFQNGDTAKLLNDLAKTIANAMKEEGYVKQ